MSNSMNKARELGKAITSSEEFKYMKECEEELLRNAGSMELYRKMNNSEEDRKKAIEDKTIAKFLEAREEFNNLMRDINTVLSHFTGLESEKSGGCGGSCGGCK